MALDLARDDGYQIFEYACHEGNRAVENSLRGSRAEEGRPRRRNREERAHTTARMDNMTIREPQIEKGDPGAGPDGGNNAGEMHEHSGSATTTGRGSNDDESISAGGFDSRCV